MGTVEFRVVPREGHWCVVVGDRHHGHYSTEKEAATDAINVARSTLLMGVLSVVTLQEEDRQIPTVLWPKAA
jgi:hypothetical protein